MAQGRFTLAYMSHDHLHGSHAGLPMIERVKFICFFLANFVQFKLTYLCEGLPSKLLGLFESPALSWAGDADEGRELWFSMSITGEGSEKEKYRIKNQLKMQKFENNWSLIAQNGNWAQDNGK